MQILGLLGMYFDAVVVEVKSFLLLLRLALAILHCEILIAIFFTFQPCHVVYTDYRPVPLQHFIFPSGGDGIHLVVDEFGKFREDNFSEAIGKLAGGEGGGQKSFKKAGQKDGSDCYNIVKMIMERNFAPVIVFSFSKKECEAYALQMSKLDFNTPEEKKLVGEVFQNAMMVLSEEDRALPQVENVLPLLKTGIVDKYN